MRTRRSFVVVGALAVALVASAAVAEMIDEPEFVPQTLNITAIVLDQECVGGDFVNVTLSATGNSSSTPEFAWDFENNGQIDVGPLSRPRVVHAYPDEVNRTAKLFARNAEGNRDTDTVTFRTLRCE